jgi:hypothetical protein
MPELEGPQWDLGLPVLGHVALVPGDRGAFVVLPENQAGD